jgi:hypothetical protein
MHPRFRHGLVTAACALLAVWLGWLAAEGSYALPALAGVVALAAILVRLIRLPADVILLGLLLIGYIVGNRGFAQLLPVPWLPLFPAEWGLAAGLGWLVVQSALRRTLPWRREALNWVILAWLVLGTIRVAVDAPRHGIMALRDYAMIYYAAFFFLAQHYAADRRSRAYLVACTLVAAAALLPVYFLFGEFPLFFVTTLAVHGIPLIYLKGDLAATFLAAGSVIVFHAARGPGRWWTWPLATAMFLTVAGGNSRASVVGGMVAMLWLLLTRRWAYPAVQGGAAAAALLGMAVLAYSGQAPLVEARLREFAERVTSMVDVTGTQGRPGDDTLDKGGNNRFRMVWWRTVLDDTWRQGPAFGLGFGHDLARSFVNAYDPLMGDDFSARSPHSIVMSVIGRMGALGMAAFLAIAGAIAQRTWRVLRSRASDPFACCLWCAAWVILTSACFGVVLEGPMGAVVFWTLLGLANGMAESRDEGVAAPTPNRDNAPHGP